MGEECAQRFRPSPGDVEITRVPGLFPRLALRLSKGERGDFSKADGKIITKGEMQDYDHTRAGGMVRFRTFQACCGRVFGRLLVWTGMKYWWVNPTKLIRKSEAGTTFGRRKRTITAHETKRTQISQRCVPETSSSRTPMGDRFFGHCGRLHILNVIGQQVLV